MQSSLPPTPLGVSPDVFKPFTDYPRRERLVSFLIDLETKVLPSIKAPETWVFDQPPSLCRVLWEKTDILGIFELPGVVAKNFIYTPDWAHKGEPASYWIHVQLSGVWEESKRDIRVYDNPSVKYALALRWEEWAITRVKEMIECIKRALYDIKD